MTNERLDELSRLCESATPFGNEKFMRCVHGARIYTEDSAGNRDLIADFYSVNNREFYFAARAAMPELIAELREAQAGKAGCEEIDNAPLCGLCESRMTIVRPGKYICYPCDNLQFVSVLIAERDAARAQVTVLQARVKVLEAAGARLRDGLSALCVCSDYSCKACAFTAEWDRAVKGVPDAS